MNTTMRIMRTPLSRLVRGQVGPVPEVDEWLVTADLPDDLRDLVRRVIRRARLMRRERAEMAAELAAHFADALAAGETAESAARAFGDEDIAAKLIRRGVIRKRPAWWHALRGTSWVTTSVAGLYIVSGVYFLSGRPTLSVDYIQKINLDTGAASAQRAWPLYSEAAAPLAKESDENRATENWEQWQYLELLKLVDTAMPGDKGFDQVEEYVRRHAESVAKTRRAASMLTLGFNVGPAGDAYDPQRYPNGSPSTAGDDPLLLVLMPHLSDLRQLATLLDADARVAQAARDPDQFMANIEALLGMSKQMSGKGHPFVTALVGSWIRERAYRALEDVLASDRGLLSDVHLARAAHGMAGPRSASDLLDLTFERSAWLDIIQRCYTDDGNGDGRLTPQGLQFLTRLSGSGDSQWFSRGHLITLASGLGPLSASRRDVTDLVDRHFREVESRFTRPFREVVDRTSTVETEIISIRRSKVQGVRFLPVALLGSSLSNLQWRVERSLVRRDGLTVAIALELHRRRTGSYPGTLDEIPRELLPSIPSDPFTGGPIQYRLVDERPIVYSVGADRDDDNGRGAQTRSGSPDLRASEWSTGNRPPPDGDWLLWPSPRERSRVTD